LIPVADPRRAVEARRDEIDTAIASVLDGGRYIFGPEHEALEHDLAAYLNVPHCVGLANGTDALEIALKAVDCRDGDEIVTAANAGFYTSSAAVAAGLSVRYADVEPSTLVLSADTVAPSLTPATRAVVVTHLYGLLADVESIVELCHAREIAVVEDCAQAAGARRGGRMAGSFGDAATFSFYPTKNLAALGDAGAIVTRDETIAARARAARQYGWRTKYQVASPGRNSRLDELQAAILRVRLPHLDRDNARRRAIVARYASALRPEAGRLVVRDAEECVCHLAVAVVEQRDRAHASLRAADIATDVHYPVPDHRQALWGDRFAQLELPTTEHACDHVLTLPCFPELRDDEVDRVCEALAEL